MQTAWNKIRSANLIRCQASRGDMGNKRDTTRRPKHRTEVQKGVRRRSVTRSQKHLRTVSVSRKGKTDQRPKWLQESHGPNCDCMTCHDYKPDHNPPLYCVAQNALGGPETGFYVCPNCGQQFRARKSVLLHMGKVPNMPASCPIFFT